MAETSDKSGQPSSTNEQSGKRALTAILGYKAIILAIIILGAVTGTIFLPVKDWLIRGLEWTQGLGIWGPALVIVFYIFACILLLPGSILTLGAGFIFKIFIGTLTVSIGSTLGACAAFLVGRTIARDWIAEKVAKNKKFMAIDEAVARQGFKIVILTRLSPVFPFNFLNYAFGLTKIKFWKYALGSWLGMIPGTIMYVYFGAGLRSLTEVATGQIEKGTAGRIFFWLGLVVTIVVTVFVTRLARNALKQTAPQTVSETTQTQHKQPPD